MLTDHQAATLLKLARLEPGERADQYLKELSGCLDRYRKNKKSQYLTREHFSDIQAEIARVEKAIKALRRNRLYGYSLGAVVFGDRINHLDAAMTQLEAMKREVEPPESFNPKLNKDRPRRYLYLGVAAVWKVCGLKKPGHSAESGYCKTLIELLALAGEQGAKPSPEKLREVIATVWAD